MGSTASSPKRPSRKPAGLEEKISRLLEATPLLTNESFFKGIDKLAGFHGEAVYASVLQILTNLEFPVNDAHDHWRHIHAHMASLNDLLGRPADLRVALLDYFLEINDSTQETMAVEIRFSREVGEFGLRDRLSGLPNYRAFKTHLVREYQRAKQFRAPLSLVLLDIDGFKEFNDRFGHAAGNEALRQVAAILTLSIRDQDILCRYGGGEFVVIVQEMAKREVLSYADSIRCKIEQHRFLDGASQPNAQLTVSGGVATYGTDTYRGAELLPLSKKALYRAKGSGKNQIKSPSDEKRSDVRMDAECTGDLWIMSINQKSFMTKNISEGGILFHTEAPLSAGEILKLRVNIGSHQGPFHCRVRVIRAVPIEDSGNFEVASEFVGLDASDRLRLSTLIQEMFSEDDD